MANITNPAGITRFETVSMAHPPGTSIVPPTQGASSGDRINETEKAPDTQLDAKPRSHAIGTARTTRI